MYIKKGVRTKLIKNDKFKTNVVGVFFSTNLNKNDVTKNALIPAVLRRGTKKYPTMRDISIELEKLYGAKFDCAVSKKGEIQVLSFYGEAVNDKYLPNSDNNTLKLAEMLKDIIFNPVMSDNKFNEDYLLQEKGKLKNIIESRKNDKVQYALERCYEIMADGEPYGLCEYGNIEDIDKVTNKELVEAYSKMLNNFNVDIIVAGNVDEKEFDKIVNLFEFSDRKEKVELTINKVEPKTVKNVAEEFEINQGKLSLAYRTNVIPNSKEYFDMLVYNGILGSGVQSKLFQNVREKNSLAYYAFSRLDKYKGIMGISSGIEQKNYQKALDTILEQVEDMKKGNITEYEYNTTIKILENSYNSLKDEQLSLVDFYYGQELINSDMSLEEIINKMKKVTVADIVKVAQQVKLDTIYFMKGR